MFRQPTQPPVQWVLSVFSWEVKLLGWNVDNSPPSSAIYTYACMAWTDTTLFFTLYSK